MAKIIAPVKKQILKFQSQKQNICLLNKTNKAKIIATVTEVATSCKSSLRKTFSL